MGVNSKSVGQRQSSGDHHQQPGGQQASRQLPARLIAIAAATVVARILITPRSRVLPAALLRRAPTAHLLAEE